MVNHFLDVGKMVDKVTIGNCTLYHADCLDIMPSLPQVDLCITSPPYGTIRTCYENLNESLFKCVADILNQKLKNNGVIVWNSGDQTKNGSETGDSFKQALYFKDIGLNIHDTMIWHKTTYLPQNNARYEQCFEYMFVLSKGKPKTFNAITVPCKRAGKNVKAHTSIPDGSFKKLNGNGKKVKDKKPLNNVWSIQPNYKNLGHPATFPIELPSRHIKTWTNENELVLDCFMGSGTTGVACINTNRQFIGIEKERKYFDIACERIQKAYELA